MKKSDIKTTKTETLIDDGVLKTYPSFTEIVTNPKYKFNLISSSFNQMVSSVFTSKWEIVVRSVNMMCIQMYELPFYESYSFLPSDDDNYDYDQSINIIGTGKVYDSRGEIYEVDYLTFLQLTLVMYMSFLGIPLTEEQFESYINFKSSSLMVYRILD